jgi:hypothetical protein
VQDLLEGVVLEPFNGDPHEASLSDVGINISAERVTISERGDEKPEPIGLTGEADDALVEGPSGLGLDEGLAKALGGMMPDDKGGWKDEQ